MVEPSGMETVGVRIQPQVLTEFHIDRDICSRATSEEGCNTTDVGISKQGDRIFPHKERR